MQKRVWHAAAIAVLGVQLAGCFHRTAAATGDPLGEFAARRAHGNGRYLTGDELAADDDTKPLAQLLSAHLLGFAETQADQPAHRPGSRCGVDIYLNGLLAPGALDQLHASDLAGIEFYQAANAPVQYRRIDSACPVLLLWLKQDRQGG